MGVATSLAYLDSCVLIYLVEQVDPWSDRIKNILNEHKPAIACGDLVRLECLVKPLCNQDQALEAAYRLKFSQMNILSHEPAVFDLAAHLRAEDPSLRTPDAIHLATALHHGCHEFWTNDRDLKYTGGGIKIRAFGQGANA